MPGVDSQFEASSVWEPPDALHSEPFIEMTDFQGSLDRPGAL